MSIAELSTMQGARVGDVVQRACGGDPEALGELYTLFYQRVLGLCRRFLSRQEDAEDATAEVFLKMQVALASYDPSLPFSRWLLSVANHHCVDKLRRRKLEGRLFAAEDVTPTIPDRPEYSPLSQVLSHERRRRICKQINRLPTHYRFALVLRYYNEMSYSEIAQTLGMGRNSVKTLMFRARKALRRRMKPQWIGDMNTPQCFPELAYYGNNSFRSLANP
jgi:RNA polymerase sigma-70 factor (ECF subfamily)